ncbi:hypothetical protein VTH06DRAFT_228 [Thermothelomyces fergusii]
MQNASGHAVPPRAPEMESPANEGSGWAGPPHKSPAALEAALDSAASTIIDVTPTQQTAQSGQPKRVFKMKRTGFSTLPQYTTAHQLSSSGAHPPATPSRRAEWEPKPVESINEVIIKRETDEAKADGDANTGGENDYIRPAMEESKAATAFMTDGAPIGIVEAEPGRPYTMWPDENGELASTHGSLLPAGYQLDSTYPGRPWVCPRVHYGACLNDNCDGTFTIKGTYQDKTGCQRKGGKILVDAPPIVVSREPLTNGSPIPKPQLPYYIMVQKGSLGIKGRVEQESRRPETRVSSQKRGDAAGLWAYVQQRLPSATDMPSSSAVKHLLSLPKRRDVKYNTNSRQKPFVEKSSRDVTAMVIQVTGDQMVQMCKRCRQGKGPFEGCVVVSQAAHDTAKRRYPCCANCLYSGKKLLCTLARSTQKWTLPAATAAAQSLRAPASSEEGNEAGLDGEAQTPRSTASDGLPSTPASLSLSDVSMDTAVASHSTFQSSHDVIKMEDWEIAPGRIRGTSTTETEAIAFSKPYLSNPTSTPYGAVPVCDDVGFRVDTVQPGDKLLLDAEADKMRLCSVAAGKVRVSIGDEPEFVLSPHGLFKVRPGVACTVRNELPFDAVLHTVVLGGY